MLDWLLLAALAAVGATAIGFILSLARGDTTEPKDPASGIKRDKKPPQSL